MNKNRFRIVFNAVRSMMMAVAEFVKSHAASADSTDASSCVNDSQNPTTPSDLPGTEATIRPFVLSIMLALGVAGIILYIAPVYADIIADPTASTNQRPVVINAPNGVPLVNIQTPSAAGVSHNIYRQFDVNTNGAILNNSRTNVQTQVGGWVQGNPYLATGTARIILNEVNSSNPSMLNGYVEVAGSRAQVVIANPAGISCNGCGFINTSRATLTTGTPLMNSGDLMGYRVGGGVIHFLGAGLDSANSNYTDVIARAVNVNVGLWAQNLNVITGSNQVTVASNGDVTGMTPISPDATLPDGSSNPKPSFTVDVAALGGMYAGKIHMIGTETGVGVRNAGNIGASAGEVTIDVDGMLTNTSTGLMSSAGNTQVTATNGVNNQGAIYSQGNITLTTEDLNNQAGYIGAKGVIAANSTAISNNTGVIISESAITLNGTSLDNQTGQIEALGNVALDISNNINNQNGLLRSGQTLTLAAANVDNRNTQGTDANNVPTQGIEAQNVSISADQIDNTSGAMRADNTLAITGSGTLNNSQGTLSSTGTLSITDRLADANSNVAGKTLAVTNTDGTMIAGTDLAIDSNSLTGDGKVLNKGNLTTKLTSDYTHTGEWQADGNATFETTGILTNQAKLLAGDTLSLTAGSLDNQTGGEIVATTLHLNATDTHTLTNRGLIDGSDTFIDTVTLNNIGTGRIYGDHVAIAATTLTNDAETVNGVTSAAVIAARDRLDIGATTITNQNEALIFSAGDMAIGGSLDSNHQTTGTAGTINNVSASIEALGDLEMSAATLINKKRVFGMSRQVTSTSTTNSLECVDPPDCDYIFHNTSTDTVYQDYVTNDSNSATILAGGNAYFTIGTTTNEYSTIASGGHLDLIGSALNNQGVELYQQTDTLLTKVLIHWGDRYHGTWTYPSSSSVLLNTVPAVISAGGDLTGTFTGNIDNVSIRQHTALTEPGSGTQLNAYTTDNVTQSPAGTGAVTLPNNSLFHTNPNPTTGYYVETDPQFANYRNWISSDYMLKALSYDPAMTTKRLGDGFYEQKLLREQINQLTGRRFLVGYTDDEAQYQALMSNGITFAQTYQLTPGIALTDAQIAQLTSDIVWLVEKTVTLADGSSAQALVPQIYVRLQAGDLNSNGALLTGNNINLKLDGDLNNNSTIAGRHVVSLNADNLNNIGGRIQAGDALSLNAQHDLNVIGTSSDISMRQSTNLSTSTAQQTTVNRVAGLYVSNPNGILVARAGNDINLNAAEIINSGSNGTTRIDAGNNLNLGTLTETTDTYGQGASGGRKGWRRENTTQEIGTVIQAEGDLTLNAGNNLSARAANVTSTNGTLTAVAGNDISIEAGKATYDMEAYRKRKSSGFLSSKSSVHHDTVNSTDVISSTFSGNTVNLNTGNDLTVKGSNIVGTNDVNLDAGNNITIESAQATHDETHYVKSKKTGFTASSTSIGYGSSKLTNTNDSQQVVNVGSTVGSVEGDVNISAGLASKNGTYTQTGSDILTPQGDINLTAQQVNIINATDTYANQQAMKYKQSGITLSVSSSALNLAQNVAGTAQAAVTSDSTHNKALNALQTYANGSTLYDQGKAITSAAQAGNVQDAASAAGVKLSVSVGSSSAKSSSNTNITAQQDSLIKAGGNVTITATQDDLTVQGSQIAADKNLTLDTVKNINLIASADTESNQSKNKSSSTSIGLSVGLGKNTGFSVGVDASRGKGKANSDSATYNNTQVSAGESLTLKSGDDTNLIGANARGKQVTATVGGDLNIESLQDTATSKAKQSNTGISISVPIGAGTGGGGFSQSKQKSSSNYASVYEQSGIKAGEGGFNITTQGNTDLKGAVIASEAPLDKNTLTTGTLTTSDIQNHMEAKASSSGTTLGTDMLTSKYALAKGIANNLMNNGKASTSDDSTTLSAIAPATITITDEAKQQALTGKTKEETVATLNRDTTNTNRVLAKPDLEALQEKAQQQQADNQLLVATATAFTDEAFRKAFLTKADIYKLQRDSNGNVVLGEDGKPIKTALSAEEKMNLKPGANGKVNVYTNGIYNNADIAASYAGQMGQANVQEVYMVYFPEANNMLSELLIAGYQKHMEGTALGLTNATQEIVNLSQQYGANGLDLTGHSRGAMTIGNALEALKQQGAANSLNSTNVHLYGPAYNAQKAANLLDGLNGDSTTSNLTLQSHEYDFVGRIIGGNSGTGGTVPDGSSVAKEILNTFTGDATVHNCYGAGNSKCAERYPIAPEIVVVPPQPILEPSAP